MCTDQDGLSRLAIDPLFGTQCRNISRGVWVQIILK